MGDIGIGQSNAAWEPGRTHEAAMLAAIVDSSNDAIISKTLDGIVTSWNRASERIFGYTAEEMIGRSISVLIPPSHREDHEYILDRVRRGERLEHFRTVRRNKAGVDLDISVTISPIRDEHGRVVGASKIARDVSELMRLDRELRLQAQSLRDLTEAMPHLVWTCDAKGSCDYLSPQWVAYTGQPAEEQLGSGWLERLHPDDREPTMAAWTRATKEGGVFDTEFRVRRADGVHRWFKTRAVSQRDERGEIMRWIGTNTDVQDLRDARERLAALNDALEARVAERTRELDAARERTRVATAAGRMAVWDWDIVTDTLLWDDVMYCIYGVDKDEFPGVYEAWRARLHPDDIERIDGEMQAALDSAEEFHSTFRILRRGEEIRQLRVSSSVQRDAEGRPVRMVGVNWDITAQMETERKLVANEALLREFVRHAPAAIAMLDRNLDYLQASDQWLRDYRLEGQNIIGRNHYDVFPEIPEHWRRVHRRVLDGAVEGCAEDPFPRADGSVEWLQWEARPWHGSSGGIEGLIFFTQVITARKEMELRLQHQKNELERSNRDLEQFAYAASHDLQEPLRAVSGCAQILARRYQGALDDSAEQLITHIVDGAERMRALIHDLLTYSRVATHGVEFLTFDSQRAAERALANLALSIEETGASIELGALPEVRGDEIQLTLLLQNLVGNALKYRGPRTPRIRIAAERTSEGWEFSVRDNGIGIEPAYYERIFVLFQRLHTRNEYPGTGIGLALCQKIVERHGGRIWVESVVDEGSDFRFTLPERGSSK